MKNVAKKKVKRHIKWKSVFAFLFFIAFLFGVFYYITHLHIKNIYISGNTILKDNDIILAANIKDYPKMTKYSIATLKLFKLMKRVFYFTIVGMEVLFYRMAKK